MASRRVEQPEPLSPLWRDALFWLALALTLFALGPFLLPGYFWGANDARHHVYFLFEFDRLVQDGVWWPRWSPDFAFGYGYPFFNIYGPLSHLIGEILHRFLRLELTAAVETVFGLGILTGAGAMYGYVRSLAGPRAGLLAAMLYTYAPYHLLVLYVRGNLAESSAFAWLPLCLWAFHRAVDAPRPATVGAAGLTYAGLMLTSNLVFVLMTPLLVAYILVLIAWRTPALGWRARLGGWIRTAIPPALGGLLGLGLSAVFWIPMALERRYVRQDQWFEGRYDYRDDFLHFFQLFSPRWGFGVSGPGPDDPIGFQIGAALLVLALLGGLAGWSRPRLRPEIGVFATAAVVAAAVGLTSFSPLWQLPVIGNVLRSAQFPWRWLPITVLCLAVLGGLMLVADPVDGEDDGNRLTLPVVVLVGAVLLASYPLLRVEIRPPAEGPVGLAALMRFQRDADEMTGSTAWVQTIPTWSPMAEYYVSAAEAGRLVTPVTSKVDYEAVDYETIAVGSVAHNSVGEEVYFCTDPGERPGECSPRDDRSITFNHFYYPGWRAYLLDGKHGERVTELPIVPEGCQPPPVSAAGTEPCPPFPNLEARATALAAATRASSLGRMTVPVPAVGEGYILLEYGDTPPRVVGTWVSVGTLLFLLMLIATPRLRALGRTRLRTRPTEADGG